MSIQDSGGMLSYADHDVHHVHHAVRFDDTADSGPTDSYTDERQFEITERGLDPDELAELRAMRATVYGIFDAEGAQDSVGSVKVKIGAGYNLSGDEYLTEGRDSESIDNDNSGTDDYTVFTKDTDEVGQLYSIAWSQVIPFDDDSNGNGGANSFPVEAETLDFEQLTGGGPVVDAADDFTSRVDIAVTNSVTEVGAGVSYSLYYAVETAEGGRTRFGR